MQTQHSAATLLSTLLGHMRPDAMEAVLESLLESFLDETEGGVAQRGVVMADYIELLIDESPLGALAREVQGALIDNTGDVFDPTQKGNVPDLDGMVTGEPREEPIVGGLLYEGRPSLGKPLHLGQCLNEVLDELPNETAGLSVAAEYVSAENVNKLKELAELTAL